MAFALILWCAGAGCMLVTYAHDAAMSGAEASYAQSGGMGWGNVSASMDRHGGCTARQASAKRAGMTASKTPSRSESTSDFGQVALPEAPSPSGVMSCCPLTSGSIVIAARTYANDANASALAQGDSLSLALRNSQPAPRAYPLRLPDHDQTYLRCCVFLI
jgi:hypothetical protein